MGVYHSAKLVRGVLPTQEELNRFYQTDDASDWLVFANLYEADSPLIGFEILSTDAGTIVRLDEFNQPGEKEVELIDLCDKYNISPTRITTYMVCQIG